MHTLLCHKKSNYFFRLTIYSTKIVFEIKKLKSVYYTLQWRKINTDVKIKVCIFRKFSYMRQYELISTICFLLLAIKIKIKNLLASRAHPRRALRARWFMSVIYKLLNFHCNTSASHSIFILYPLQLHLD